MSCVNSLLQQTFLCSWFRMIIYLTTASDDIAVSFRPLREEFLFLNHRGFPKPNHCQTRVNLTEKPSNLSGIHFSLFLLLGHTHLHLHCIYGTSSASELPPALCWGCFWELSSDCWESSSPPLLSSSSDALGDPHTIPSTCFDVPAQGMTTQYLHSGRLGPNPRLFIRERRQDASI